MGSQIVCGTCGEVLKTFNDDCQHCLGKDTIIPEKEDVDYELLFKQEKERRERLENEIKKRDRRK